MGATSLNRNQEWQGKWRGPVWGDGVLAETWRLSGGQSGGQLGENNPDRAKASAKFLTWERAWCAQRAGRWVQRVEGRLERGRRWGHRDHVGSHCGDCVRPQPTKCSAPGCRSCMDDWYWEVALNALQAVFQNCDPTNISMQFVWCLMGILDHKLRHSSKSVVNIVVKK